jgi:dTDP-4-amino-4,6-dideoxygalactose transaminase
MNKIRTKPFPAYVPFGEEEVRAAADVVRTGMLSDYVGRDCEKFRGGKHVLEFERAWAAYHGVKHAISFNSASSALTSALAAVGVGPADEVLVVPYSMCISATAPLACDAVPVFVDIEDHYYCMDPAKIRAKITPRTKAILPVDLFGQSADLSAIVAMAREHGLKVVSDAAHVPGCRYGEGFAGTFADIGVYSLNQHKIIHCGEGGIAVTNDDDLALRLQLLRNHAEAVVGDMGYANLANMLGGNYRLPEVEAAIASEQLKKLPRLLAERVALADYLTEKLSKLEFLTPPAVRPGSEHTYYLYPIRYHAEATGVDREEYVRRINELGIPLYRLAAGYIKPLYLEPIFTQSERFRRGFPWSLLPPAERPRYERGLCPVTEHLYDRELIVTAYTYPPLTRADMDDIVRAFTQAGRRA